MQFIYCPTLNCRRKLAKGELERGYLDLHCPRCHAVCRVGKGTPSAIPQALIMPYDEKPPRSQRAS